MAERDRGNFEEQSISGMQRAVFKGEISVADFYERQVGTGDVGSYSYDIDILPLLEEEQHNGGYFNLSLLLPLSKSVLQYRIEIGAHSLRKYVALKLTFAYFQIPMHRYGNAALLKLLKAEGTVSVSAISFLFLRRTIVTVTQLFRLGAWLIHPLICTAPIISCKR